ncbi:unnamed protein product [Nezara viridula]|uniref:Uncharacterized protein n=1 Tax=Nezara viridula TaxID=85310 RepID=A0A9P0HEA5_NEZVI|nr:unnamed protein product [Nezara viridula]
MRSTLLEDACGQRGFEVRFLRLFMVSGEEKKESIKTVGRALMIPVLQLTRSKPNDTCLRGVVVSLTISSSTPGHSFDGFSAPANNKELLSQLPHHACNLPLSK